MKDFNEIKDEIKKELLELGFVVESIGFVYWVDAINIIYVNPLFWDIMDIYGKIAIQYGTTTSRVERNMRTAIEPAIKNIQIKYGYYRKIKNNTYLSLIRYKLI